VVGGSGRGGLKSRVGAFPTHARLHGIGGNGVMDGHGFPLLLSLSFPWCAFHLLGSGLGGGHRGASNVPPLRGQRTGTGLYIISL